MTDAKSGCQRSWITVEDGNGLTVQLPLLTAQGQNEGPTVVVLGGVHGDEYEGMVAVRSVFAALDPATLNGTVLGVPVCNPPAFAAATRESPVDGLNLARIFPGRPDGSISERIADALTTKILAQADFLIDLHSSGSRMSSPLLIGYAVGDSDAARTSHEAALRFGVPVVWGHERVAPGRSLSGPHDAGVPWLYTECPSGGWLHQDIAETYAKGVLNVLRYLGMIPGDAPMAAVTHQFVGDGDVDQSLSVPVGGFLTPQVDLLDRVSAGDLLGTIEDARGEVLAELKAPAAGTVILRRESPAVATGDIAFLLT